MTVKRIVANIATPHVDKAKAFYSDILGLDRVMDMGWIATYEGSSRMHPQISFASEGGSDTPVPDLSIEVDDLEEAVESVLPKYPLNMDQSSSRGECGSTFEIRSAGS